MYELSVVITRWLRKEGIHVRDVQASYEALARISRDPETYAQKIGIPVEKLRQFIATAFLQRLRNNRPEGTAS